jgi:Phospholipase_D-nuclease N-terminal
VRFLPLIIVVVLAIYCLVEIAQSDPRDVRQLPRSLWALVVLVPVAGPVAWLVYGRPNGEVPAEPVGRPRPRQQQPREVAPDDDPDFLRSIKFDPPDAP